MFDVVLVSDYSFALCVVAWYRPPVRIHRLNLADLNSGKSESAKKNPRKACLTCARQPEWLPSAVPEDWMALQAAGAPGECSTANILIVLRKESTRQRWEHPTKKPTHICVLRPGICIQRGGVDEPRASIAVHVFGCVTR